MEKASIDDKRCLKETFESEFELSTKKNPAKYIDKLLEVQDELRRQHGYIKTDEDVVDQVMKVVSKKYDPVVFQIMTER